MTLGPKQTAEKPWARFGWSRPPFYVLGLLSPFLLGALLAWRLHRTFDLPVFSLALSGLLLVILAADQTARQLGDRAASGPAHPLPGPRTSQLKRLLTPPQRARFIALALAGIIGLFLQFGLSTGPYTVPLGLLATLPVLLYLPPPLRLVERACGDLALAACYGWSPAALSFYLQQGYVHPFLFWMAMPIGLSILNVILVSEFRRARRVSTGDGFNLLARLGPARARALFGWVSMLSWLALYASIQAGVPPRAFFFYLPVLALSACLSLLMVRKRYEDPLMLEIIRGLTVAVSLGTMVVYLLALL